RNSMQCGNAPVFLAGDADADAPVLHEATIDGAIAGLNAARFPDVRTSARPIAITITFTDPPCAIVGVPPDAGLLIGTVDYARQGRAKVEGYDKGLVRLYADRSGKLVGASLFAPAGEHLAHLLAWAIQCDQTAEDLLEFPLYHPTYEEGLRTALREICE